MNELILQMRMLLANLDNNIKLISQENERLRQEIEKLKETKETKEEDKKD